MQGQHHLPLSINFDLSRSVSKSEVGQDGGHDHYDDAVTISSPILNNAFPFCTSTSPGPPLPQRMMSLLPLTPNLSLLNTQSGALPQEGASRTLASLSTTRDFPETIALRIDVSTVDARSPSGHLVAGAAVRMTPSVPINFTAGACRFVYLQHVLDEVADELGIALQDDSCFDYSIADQTDVSFAPSPIFISSRYVKLASFAARADFSDQVLESTSSALDLETLPAEASLDPPSDTVQLPPSSLLPYQLTTNSCHCPSACTCQCCASFVFDCVSLKEPRPTLDVPASEVCFPFACTCQCCASLPFACVSLKEPSDTLYKHSFTMESMSMRIYQHPKDRHQFLHCTSIPARSQAAPLQDEGRTGTPPPTTTLRYYRSSHTHPHDRQHPNDPEDGDYPELPKDNEGRMKMTDLMLDEG
ncbi:BZ3500_MvSof-1268-A1-R1_Chr8-2g10168 [Microbotryum saponariae]|uniref:BZ3500_MvSof-1268-A1-R1_Chr8-2g10168 protein n=1 Tax=Microbotryum saponariae TaxID=289078 RepID=A0A2X0MQ01_9BASI|nr:BZ3500_MvSof-1268-A1-R1_Chr8-2g10168 [Microbotryum saponariae]SDA01924.1 BZ3501_MvSof-1269-A2-R1_Chr8-2g09919 [Microbotryum saponariae]